MALYLVVAMSSELSQNWIHSNSVDLAISAIHLTVFWQVFCVKNVKWIAEIGKSTESEWKCCLDHDHCPDSTAPKTVWQILVDFHAREVLLHWLLLFIEWAFVFWCISMNKKFLITLDIFWIYADSIFDVNLLDGCLDRISTDCGNSCDS